MELSERVLGHSAVLTLTERNTSPVLVIGKDKFTRADLASVACFNFLAAQRLSSLFHEIGVADTRDVFERLSPSALALPTIGAISLAVLGAAFEARRLGGGHPLESWVIKHAANPDKPFRTFDTIKNQQRKRENDERRRRRSRRRPPSNAVDKGPS